MLLSKVLNDYYVMPLGQSEIVGYDSNEHNEICIDWMDGEEGKRHSQEFLDQEIHLDPASFLQGQFAVTTLEGDVVSFIALDGVAL